MTLQTEAVYENGVLKLDQPLPLQEQERVFVTVQPKIGHAKNSYGFLKWTGDVQALDDLLSADNHSWALEP